MSQITHIIYDMDGVLLDTEDFYTEVTQEIVSQWGKTFDWSVKSKMIGRPNRDAAQALIDALSLPITPEEYLDARRGLLEAIFPTAQPFPGAQALTKSMREKGIPQAIATSSHARDFELKMQSHQHWLSDFDVIVKGDDPAIKKGKPAPDIFLAAAERLGAQPECCLVFEDSPSGMVGALAANMTVVAVPDPNMDKKVYKDAHLVLNALTEFQPNMFGLG